LEQSVDTPRWVSPSVEDSFAGLGNRIWESLPGLISWAVLLAPIWLTILNQQAGEWFVFLATAWFGARATYFGVRALINRRAVLRSMEVDWLARLEAECR